MAALAAAFVPLPQGLVERWYSTGLYLYVQPVMTRVSNLVPFALFDALILGTVAAWLILAIAGRRRGIKTLAMRTVSWGAVLYLAFLLLWGLNYRRTSLADKLQFDAGSVSPDAALTMATEAIDRLNGIHDPAHATGWESSATLAYSFDRVQRALGAAKTAVPARPKQTLLSPFFRMAGVEGMTDPYFLETLIESDLLPFERPMVIAHEWGHLAGFADESEASFVGWLTCLHSSVADQYSGWLFLFEELAPVVRQRDRADLLHRMAAGPVADLRAVNDRRQRHINRAVAGASGRVYDRYLKANRVESGIESYDEVVRLALGVRFGPDWTPELRGHALP